MPDADSITISRQELYDEIWKDTAAHTAQKYGINYARFLNLCKENNIPVPPSGYWTKLSFGKPVKHIPLPESEITEVTLSNDPLNKIKKPAGRPRKSADANVPATALSTDSRKNGKSIEPKATDSIKPIVSVSYEKLDANYEEHVSPSPVAFAEQRKVSEAGSSEAANSAAASADKQDHNSNILKPNEAIPPAGIVSETVQPLAENERPSASDGADNSGKIRLVIDVPSNNSKKPYERETLYKEVWAEPVTTVAQRYNVSDNALRNACRTLNVPFPERGYWAKLRAGKPVEKAPLPKVIKPKESALLKLSSTRPLHVADDALSFFVDEDRAQVLNVASRLRVHGPSVQMQKEIVTKYNEAEKWIKEHKDGLPKQYGRGYVETVPFMAGVISQSSLSRAFRIVDTLAKAVISLGGSIDYHPDFHVNGEYVSFTMSESKDEIPHEMTKAEKIELLKYEEQKKKNPWASKPNIPKYEHPWNGKLCIIISEKHKFRDCKEYSLEDRIGEMLVALFEASYPIRVARLDKEAEEQRRREAEQRRQEKIDRYNLEVSKTKGLVNAAKDYDTACKIRAYIYAVEAKGTLDDETAEWIRWAKQKADWYDPTISRKDEFLGERKHEENADRKGPEEISRYRW